MNTRYWLFSIPLFLVCGILSNFAAKICGGLGSDFLFMTVTGLVVIFFWCTLISIAVAILYPHVLKKKKQTQNYEPVKLFICLMQISALLMLLFVIGEFALEVNKKGCFDEFGYVCTFLFATYIIICDFVITNIAITVYHILKLRHDAKKTIKQHILFNQLTILIISSLIAVISAYVREYSEDAFGAALTFLLFFVSIDIIITAATSAFKHIYCRKHYKIDAYTQAAESPSDHTKL
ncbi:MAG: hypothetical protein NC485_06200 [Ruminococcus flavefaciens]|nr:hypothetical protein [Ruminococcus flavefaciens]MCM1060432.1 hypothetical protein [Eubacterium sp.]